MEASFIELMLEVERECDADEPEWYDWDEWLESQPESQPLTRKLVEK